ncbi:thiamine pyrophosphate-dependent dehydrogenase E1 component subunit alpha [Helcobacillus massiliensis]|uniref:thiamine pyrophosphate-dependent dehydrogenase E1 component subunit alpha n=1 Tax=Helcobacillus massiliensis TaxID=521392 RepID=UPI002954E59E|nr:thiamine pyrophosphate-dependent dehydrogenase E1 component subunit alpha [Helcobacillus massiliensis]WOO93118.1 thiamine pyrophosphate-dependent dehydrogenase E1 component subunit alpha [Helcobacillus massiliensis]
MTVFRTSIPQAPQEEPTLRLLEADGTRHPHEELDAAIADVTAEQMRGFYRDMVMIRAADLEATNLQRQGQLGLWASALGQEGAQIGAGHACRPHDYLVPTYREHGIAWARGIEPWRLLEMFRGVSHLGWDPKALKTHPYMIVLGSQVPQGVGYAMGIKRDGLVDTGDPDKDTAVLTLFGDGASSEGEVSEGFTWAASFQTPTVFFTQNNQWAISVPTSVQTRVPLAQRSRGWGIPSARVDGNDVLGVLAATRIAMDAARSGGGPRFIEALTYRMAAHTTSDDATRYRPSEEEESWRQKDPIKRLGAHLDSLDEIDDDFVKSCEAEGHNLAMELHHHIHALPDPDPREMFEYVYAEPHPLIEEERAQFEAFQAQFEEDE